jgi:peroxiredoxin/outer membrane lipoprotein-sorting protein
MRGIVFIFLLVQCFVVPTNAGDDGLIARVAQRYTGLENYYVKGTFFFVAELAGTSQEFNAPFIQAGSPPGRMRMEIDHDALGSVVVSDGEATWTYFKVLGQYQKRTAVPLEGSTGEGGEAKTMPTAGGSFLGMYKSIADEARPTRVVGKADIRLDGRLVNCTVIELARSEPDSTGLVLGPDTVWVDPDNALVLKSVHSTKGDMRGMETKTRMKLTYDVIRMDEEPPEELFVFEPPAGAEEVDDFGMGGASRPDFSGTEAPDFRLTDLDGRPHRLRNYRGKVVLLDFWASWCTPCRKELPTIEKLHREYGSKGLVVLAVNSEADKVARSFVKKYGYTFTVLTDVEGSVFGDYAVSSIPVTIVIDREGLIVDHFIGYHGEEALLSSIRKGGIQ